MGKAIFLIVAIVMPRDVPDIQHAERMQSFEACWDGARAYMQHELTDEMREKGAIGLSATCAFRELPSQKD